VPENCKFSDTKSERFDMTEYNILTEKSVEKKLKLKNYTLELVKNLKRVNLNALYPTNYISDNGNTQEDYTALIKRLENCSSNTTYQKQTFAHKTTGEITSRKKTLDAQSCHVYSLCPVCASAKRAEILQSLKPYMDVLKQAQDKKEVFLYTGTITIEDTDNPSKDYDRLRDSWTRFNKLGQIRQNGQYSYGEAAKIIGSLLSIEIVPKPDGKYHVHGHALFVNREKFDFAVYDPIEKKKLELLYGYGNIPKEELEKIETIDGMSKLTKEWFSVSGAKNFWVRPLRDMVQKRDGKLKRIPIENQLMELVKYSTKPWEVPAENAFKLYDALTNKKRITKSGIFTNSKRHKKIFDVILNKRGLLDNFYAAKYRDIDEIDEELELINSELNTVQMESHSFAATGHLFAKEYLEPKNRVFAKRNVEYQTTSAFVCNTPLYVIQKQTPEHKRYMADRMKFVNEYRTLYSNLKKSLPLVRKGIVKSADWIDCKKRLKAALIEQMAKHALKIFEYKKEPERFAV